MDDRADSSLDRIADVRAALQDRGAKQLQKAREVSSGLTEKRKKLETYLSEYKADSEASSVSQDVGVLLNYRLFIDKMQDAETALCQQQRLMGEREAELERQWLLQRVQLQAIEKLRDKRRASLGRARQGREDQDASDRFVVNRVLD